jgi:hypothetical protein
MAGLGLPLPPVDAAPPPPLTGDFGRKFSISMGLCYY